ncbi:MAG: hypothetical protein N3D82_01315 [Ignisphaera sp.]|nr:hypothetical protein [Ignisphaera sp.]MCX8167656.1 hypothetical protein [Ignisphaera sp.]MDW8085646.1 hypothetical protein [Ignisphaera sp.]
MIVSETPGTALILYIAAPIVVAVAAALLYNFPSMLRPPRIRCANVVLSGPVVVVSDVHIGSRKSYYMVLGRLIKRWGLTTITVAGDLLDRRIPPSDIVNGLKSAIEALGLERGRIIYIASTASHDIDSSFEKPLHLTINSISIHVVSGVARILIDGCSSYILATHGEYVSRDGVVAHLLDRLGISLFRKSLTSLLIRRMLRAEKAAWIILGHSHIPFIDHTLRVINTGSWDDRAYAPVKPAVGIVKCINGKLDAKFLELPLKSSATSKSPLIEAGR